MPRADRAGCGEKRVRREQRHWVRVVTHSTAAMGQRPPDIALLIPVRDVRTLRPVGLGTLLPQDHAGAARVRSGGPGHRRPRFRSHTMTLLRWSRLSNIRRRDARRRPAVVVLALQALLWMAGPTIEARAEARSAGAAAHVEEPGASKCPPIHSHLDCQVCRTLRSGATPSPSVALPSANTGVVRGTAPSPSTAPHATTAGPLGSRAPPV
jgi:hypothetical protein